MKAHYEKKVNSIVIKETTIFKKSSSKRLWNLKNVAVMFTDGSELSDQHNAIFQSPQRNMQNNACTEQVRGGRGGRDQKKLMHKMEGELFFSFFEILDVNRKQPRQPVKSTEFCKYPIGKINGVFSPPPMFKPDMV